ncbi:MAG: DHH family phosphoesterase [Candidatus Uhrbacteria bacterium]
MYSILEQMHEKLVAAERPLLVADERLDGDSLGSSLAVADYLLRLGKPVQIFVSEAVPEKYRLLPHQEKVFFDQENLSKLSPDLIVTFDCSDEDYINSVIEKLNGPRPMILNFDHHITNSKFGHLHFVDIEAPATCEIIHRFFKVNKIEVTREMATCLFSGLVFDTTSFSNDATTATALASASELLLAGARGGEAIRLLLKNRSLPALRLWGVALERLWFHEEYQAVATCITSNDMENFQVSEDEIDGLSNFLQNVVANDTICVIRETKDGGVKFSLRTHTGDVAVIARANGGGGHAKAAGFTVSNTRLIPSNNGSWKMEKTVV